MDGEMGREMGRRKKEKRQKNGSRGERTRREGKGENRVKTEVVKRKQGVYVYECVLLGAHYAIYDYKNSFSTKYSPHPKQEHQIHEVIQNIILR